MRMTMFTQRHGDARVQGYRRLIPRDAERSEGQLGGLCMQYCLLQLLELRLAWVAQLVPWVGGLARYRQCTWQDRPADWSLLVVLATPALDWRATVGGLPEEAVAVGELRWKAARWLESVCGCRDGYDDCRAS